MTALPRQPDIFSPDEKFIYDNKPGEPGYAEAVARVAMSRGEKGPADEPGISFQAPRGEVQGFVPGSVNPGRAPMAPGTRTATTPGGGSSVVAPPPMPAPVPLPKNPLRPTEVEDIWAKTEQLLKTAGFLRQQQAEFYNPTGAGAAGPAGPVGPVAGPAAPVVAPVAPAPAFVPIPKGPAGESTAYIWHGRFKAAAGMENTDTLQAEYSALIEEHGPDAPDAIGGAAAQMKRIIDTQGLSVMDAAEQVMKKKSTLDKGIIAEKVDAKAAKVEADKAEKADFVEAEQRAREIIQSTTLSEEEKEIGIKELSDRLIPKYGPDNKNIPTVIRTGYKAKSVLTPPMQVEVKEYVGSLVMGRQKRVIDDDTGLSTTIYDRTPYGTLKNYDDFLAKNKEPASANRKTYLKALYAGNGLKDGQLDAVPGLEKRLADAMAFAERYAINRKRDVEKVKAEVRANFEKQLIIQTEHPDLWAAWKAHDPEAKEKYKDQPVRGGKEPGAARMAAKADMDAAFAEAKGDPAKMREILTKAGLRF
jgi:hypothetical protein